jgi:hypothetical protein
VGGWVGGWLAGSVLWRYHPCFEQARNPLLPDAMVLPNVLTHPAATSYFHLCPARCILSEGGQAVALTEDHKPTDPDEAARVHKVRATQACIEVC